MAQKTLQHMYDFSCNNGELIQQWVAQQLEEGYSRETILEHITFADKNPFNVYWTANGLGIEVEPTTGLPVDTNVGFVYNSIKELYARIDNMDQQKLREGVLIVNPPYSPKGSKNLYMEIMEKLGGRFQKEIWIVPANGLSGTGPGGNRTEWRKRITTQSGFKLVRYKPIGTFKRPDDGKPVLTATCIIHRERGYTGPTEIQWELDGKLFSTTDQINGTGKEILRYLGNEGKNIMDILKLYPVQLSTDGKRNWRQVKTQGGVSFGDHPHLHFNEKLDTGYFGQVGRNDLSKLDGSKVLRGVVEELNGKPYEPKKTKGREAPTSNRLINDFEYEWQTRNGNFWYKTRLFGLGIIQTSTQHSNSVTTLGKMPMIVLEGDYATVEDYEEAVYRALVPYGMTPKLVDWIQTVGGRKQTVWLNL